MVDERKYRFPGMDPWLEHPAIWPDVHHRLITYIADDLAGQLSPRYSARHGERIVIEPAGRLVAPDVVLTRRPQGDMSSVAVAEATAPIVVHLPPMYVRQPFLEIRDRRTGNRVVTVIEVLSPTNKRSGTDGRAKYLEKQAEVLASDASLVEIDLLRGGEHTVALPVETCEDLRPHDYLVVTRRAGRSEEAEAYPIALADRLPVLRIPLVAPDPDAKADLQPLIERAYAAGGYAQDLDYARPPLPPLARAASSWARRISRPTGRRRRT